MKTLSKYVQLCGLMSILTFAAPVSAGGQFSNEWEIGVSGSADASGSISFALTFKPANDGTARDPITIVTSVAADTSKDDIVNLIGNSFSAALGEDDFDVGISWGEHVKVAAEGDTPDFALTVGRNTLQSVSIEINY